MAATTASGLGVAIVLFSASLPFQHREVAENFDIFCLAERRARTVTRFTSALSGYALERKRRHDEVFKALLIASASVSKN
jgi:hypothetical protein